jgi:polysaccharide export outer membrane protein
MKPAKSKATHLLAAAMTAVMLAGCSGYHPAPRAFHEAVMQPYRLDAGDRLRVTVFEQDGLTGTYTIDQSGYIAFPLIGAVPARGRTLQELEGNIAASLRQGYLRDPDVSIEIDRYRSFYIMGEVGQAGQYSYVAGMTVQNAIAIAGGYSSRANQRNVDITRNINGKIMTGRVRLRIPSLLATPFMCASGCSNHDSTRTSADPALFPVAGGRHFQACAGSRQEHARLVTRLESCAIPRPAAPMRTSSSKRSCRI